jgi:hypothetical protein
MVEMIVYSIGESRDEVFDDVELSIKYKLLKAGYQVAECRSNRNFRIPKIKIEAYRHETNSYETNSYLNGEASLEPATKGYRPMTGQPMFFYLRIKMDI